jgi:predicted  nucleic acid-binding Zn-ribbon protein
MREHNHEDIEKKDLYQKEVATFKKKYKVLKEKLEWADDSFEEETIQEEMNHYATQIRTLNKKLAALSNTEQKA